MAIHARIPAWRKPHGQRSLVGYSPSLTQWTWVWANSGRWWRTEKSGVLQSMGSQRVRHDLVTEQQWWTFPVVMSIINCHGTCEYVFQFSSVTQSCPTLCDSMDCSTLGLPIHHQLLEFTQAHVHRVGDAIQPSHPLSSPSPPAFNLSQHQGSFRWASSLHQVAKVLEFQLQHQSFQRTPRTDFF